MLYNHFLFSILSCSSLLCLLEHTNKPEHLTRACAHTHTQRKKRHKDEQIVGAAESGWGKIPIVAEILYHRVCGPPHRTRLTSMTSHLCRSQWDQKAVELKTRKEKRRNETTRSKILKCLLQYPHIFNVVRSSFLHLALAHNKSCLMALNIWSSSTVGPQSTAHSFKITKIQHSLREKERCQIAIWQW